MKKLTVLLVPILILGGSPSLAGSYDAAGGLLALDLPDQTVDLFTAVGIWLAFPTTAGHAGWEAYLGLNKEDLEDPDGIVDPIKRKKEQKKKGKRPKKPEGDDGGK